ncbi:hypothetical protein Tco_0000529 [Tanacetum coccineum]
MDDPNITIEEYIRLEEEKARRRGKVYNRESAMYGKIWYDEDVYDLRSVETEFPAIVCNDTFTSDVTPYDFEKEFPAIAYNDALTSKLDFLTEPTMSPQHINEFNLKDKHCPNDNDDDKIDIKQFLRGNVINTDVGVYAQGSNKLLETSHDKSDKFFKAETFIKKLNFNIMTWNHLNKGMSFIFLNKNLYVPFGIPFDPKLFYKDGIKLGLSIRHIQTPWIWRIDLLDVIQSLFSSTIDTAYSLNKNNVFDTGINMAYP